MTRFDSKQIAISTLDNKIYSLTEHVQLFYGWWRLLVLMHN